MTHAPAGWVFNPPPGWPVPPPGWTPPPGWRPDPGLPAPPADWAWWVPAGQSGQAPAAVAAPPVVPPPPAAMPMAPAVAASPVAGTASALPPLPARNPEAHSPSGMFGKGRQLELLQDENHRLWHWASTALGVDAVALTAQADRLKAEVAELNRQTSAARAQLAALRRTVAVTEEVSMLQEIGVYEYAHPLDDAVAYQSRLTKLKDSYKSMARNGRGVSGSTQWSVNNSLAEGRKMVRDFSKLMLRAYNAEADSLVRTMKPYKLKSAVDRLNKTADTIAKLGKTMQIYVTTEYHRARLEELALTADYLTKSAEEKERQREERARVREEEKAQRDFEREKARLLKQQAHYAAVLARHEAAGNDEAAAEIRAKLEEVGADIGAVEQREANIRAGYVYVISNIGSFGEDMVKIGMTRRLDPMDRVRELGDASVPFRFDVHALIFSDDAVGLENRLHKRLADRRVNRVNQRREFFRATPAEVRAVLERTGDTHLLEYREVPEAEEWRTSRNLAAA